MMGVWTQSATSLLLLLVYSSTLAFCLIDAQIPEIIELDSAGKFGKIRRFSAQHDRLFALTIDSSWANQTDSKPSDRLHVTASLASGPDLPGWLSLDFQPPSSHRHHHHHRKPATALIYGFPPVNVSHVELEVVVVNLRSYNTRLHHLIVSFSRAPDVARRYEVQLKINNVRPVDLFSDNNNRVNDRQHVTTLLHVLYQFLWPQAETSCDTAARRGLLATSITHSLLPPPSAPPISDGFGVLLRLASCAPFSPQLLRLQQETRPLWPHSPCPWDFKRASVERHFRRHDFLIDWCMFRLLKDGKLFPPKEHDQVQTGNNHSQSAGNVTTSITSWSHYQPALPPSLAHLSVLPRRVDSPRRFHGADWLRSVVAPLMVAIVLVAALAGVFCRRPDSLESDSKEEFLDGVFSAFGSGPVNHVSSSSQPRRNGRRCRSADRQMSLSSSSCSSTWRGGGVSDPWRTGRACSVGVPGRYRDNAPARGLTTAASYHTHMRYL